MSQLLMKAVHVTVSVVNILHVHVVNSSARHSNMDAFVVCCVILTTKKCVIWLICPNYTKCYELYFAVMTEASKSKQTYGKYEGQDKALPVVKGGIGAKA